MDPVEGLAFRVSGEGLQDFTGSALNPKLKPQFRA